MKFLKVKFAFFFLILQVFTAGDADDTYQSKGGNRKKSSQADYYDDYSMDYSEDYEGEGQDGSCNTCGQAAGERPVAGKVINGIPVQPTYKYPWIVALVKNGKIMCGGALVSATSIITAGHCVFNKQQLRNPQCSGARVHRSCYANPNSIQVRLAGAEQQDASSTLAVGRIIGHPMYSFGTQANDIAIIQLAQPVRCSQRAMPVCVPTSGQLRIGTPLVTAGYGFNTPEGNRGPQILREGAVKAIPPRRCAAKPHERTPNFLKTIVCAAGMESGQSSCFGDSGSALISYIGNKYYAVGVVSKGKSMQCGPQNPVTYTKTFTSLRFIRQNVRDLPQSE